MGAIGAIMVTMVGLLVWVNIRASEIEREEAEEEKYLTPSKGEQKAWEDYDIRQW
jgi:hypothetical protein